MLMECKNVNSENITAKDCYGINNMGLRTIKQFCEIHPWPSESAMRAYIYRADELGIAGAFFRVGRRVLVDPEKFFFLIKQIENRFNKGDINETMSYHKGATHK